MRRAGFTLLEVMIGLVVGALVVTLGYGALQGGLDTGTRLERHRNRGEATLMFRTLLADALRHAVPGVGGGPTVFVLTDRRTADGLAADSLTFLSRGIASPLGTSAAWHVTLAGRGDSLRLVARPAGEGREPAVVATIEGARLEVEALGRGPLATWTPAWPDPGVAPEAVRLVMGDAAPLVVRVGLERAP